MAPLVDYSDTDSDTEPDVPEPAAKRRRLEQDQPASSDVPALPASFYSLYATNVRTTTSDDPSQHGGRTRQVAHKEGNWPTHIYLEWYPSEAEESEIGTVIDAARQIVPETHSFLRSSLDVRLPLHISLSAPLVLETEQKDKFHQAVVDAVSKSDVRRFSVMPCAVSWVANFDKTRHFLVLKLTPPGDDELNKLLQACNACARHFELAELYHGESESSAAKKESRDDYFHISIAWTLDEPIQDAQKAVERSLTARLREREITFSTVKLKVGNVVHDIALPAG